MHLHSFDQPPQLNTPCSDIFCALRKNDAKKSEILALNEKKENHLNVSEDHFCFSVCLSWKKRETFCSQTLLSINGRNITAFLSDNRSNSHDFLNFTNTTDNLATTSQPVASFIFYVFVFFFVALCAKYEFHNQFFFSFLFVGSISSITFFASIFRNCW